jgi:hypothetical protein
VIDYRRVLDFGFLAEFIELITASKDYALTVLHTSQIAIGHTMSSQSVTLLIKICVVAVSNGGHSLLLVPELFWTSAVSFSQEQLTTGLQLLPN